MVKTHNQKIATLFAGLALGCLASVPVTARAGTEVASGKESKNVVEEIKKSCITGDLGVTITNDYVSRGILQTPEAGVKYQPYLDLYFKLYEGTGFVNNVTFQLGFWSNIETYTHGTTVQGTPTAGTTLPQWEEFDYTPGIAVTFEKNFTATFSYFEFDSPNNSFYAARSFNLNLAYNDTDLLGTFALHPHIAFLQELQHHAGLNSGGNPKKLGQYYEVGIAPGYTFLKDSKYPLTLTIPVNLGFGSNGFYGRGFGYVSAGGSLSVPLAFIPSCYGSWTASAGGTYYYLGDRTADVAGPGTFSSHGDRPSIGVASATIGLTF